MYLKLKAKSEAITRPEERNLVEERSEKRAVTPEDVEEGEGIGDE